MELDNEVFELSFILNRITTCGYEKKIGEEKR
jgi:hypothetical protein